jgi:amino acid adenylation domain-containing protein
MATTHCTSRLSEEEQRQQVFDWNRTETDYPRQQCIHQIFEEMVERNPDAIALCFRDRQMTYRELNEKANQLAHRLRKLGVGPEVMVTTLLERSLELFVGLLGILKAGGAFVPLDPIYPAERLAFMATDTKAPVMLAQEHLLQKLTPRTWCEATVVRLDAGLSEISSENSDNLANLTMASNLAYVMYTSGSTGLPKGVMVNHRAVVRLVKNTNYAELSEQEVFLQFSPISFDASTLEIWAPLLNGGRLAIMPPETQSLDELGAAIRKHGVNSMWLTAGLFNLMVEQRLSDLQPLRQLLVGGDALSPVHVRKAVEGLPACRLINGYGPTEGTTFTCCHTITTADTQGASIPIGRPIANTQVYLLDSNHRVTPIGEPGELCVAGDGLARGYLNQPELTAQKFVAHPFSNQSGARVYKTGDMARYRSDGVIEFLGRADSQVKISGYRIELAEIETNLMQHPGVRSVAVIARQEPLGEKKLIAYIVPSRQDSGSDELRTFLERKLPAYMLPSAFVFLKSLPLSPNGKVDRNALPAPESVSRSAASASASPQTELEQKIAKVWGRVLGVEQVGLNDNFFDMGGDSLSLLEAHAELQKVVSSPLTITDLFEYTTISALAGHLAGHHGSNRMSDAHERARRQRTVWVREKKVRSVQSS